MTVLISGASGFIAGRCARKLKQESFRIVGISRRPGPIPGFDVVYPGNLMMPLGDLFDRESIQTFIHCANHSGKNDFEVNVEGTKLWAEQAAQKGVQLQIFLSSLSAKEESDSSYARAKFVLERWFLERCHVSLSLGLVIGSGGLFRNMVSLIKKYPVLPIPDSGKRKVYVTGIDFLCDAIWYIVKSPASKGSGEQWSLFHPDPVTLKVLLNEIRVQSGSRCVFIPIPSALILAAVRVIEHIPFINLSVSRNNIIGLRQDELPASESDFAKFDIPGLSLAELVRKAIERMQQE